MRIPYLFQQQIIDNFKDESHAAIFGEPGVGKTLIAQHLLKYKYNQHRGLLPTVIFCPGIVINNWKEEFALNTKVEPFFIGTVLGTKKKRIKTISHPNHKILIINYEATRTLEIKQLLTKFDPKIVVCDESHMIKSPKSQAFKNVLDISAGAWYRYILTGTPISKSAEDLWSQFMFMDRGKTFGHRFYSFKKRYFIDLNQGWSGDKSYPKWVFNKSLESEFKTKMSASSVSLKAKDCLELPKRVDVTIHIDPSPEQKRHYKEIKNELITWIDGKPDDPMVVKNALTKTLRLAEILSGYLKLESDDIEPLKKNPKLDGLMSLIESTNPHKIIVYCVFKQNYADISARLKKEKIQHVMINGQVSTEDKIKNVETFNNMSNNCRVAIVNPKSGGVGINMKSARYAAYFSAPYSLIDFEQSRARNYRAGSIEVHDKITHYFLVHKGLIDEKIVASLRDKKELAKSLLDIKKLI